MFSKNELIPAIVQDFYTREVLMLAYMNEESFGKTVETKKTWFYSRSRKELWNKGLTSGNFQNVVDIKYDCDEDTLLILVIPQGPSCHTDNYSCFYRNIDAFKNIPTFNTFLDVENTIKNRYESPVEGSYTNYLFDKGLDKILKKVGEESAEVIIAAKNNSKDELILETSDLLYHLLVLLKNQDIQFYEVLSELNNRKS